MRSGSVSFHQSTTFVGVMGLTLLIAVGFAETKEAHRTPPCDVDCVSRDAGYAWGKELGIDDPSECGGNSADFIAGCQAYATKHEDPMALPADDAQSDQQSDDEQDQADGMTVDDNVNVLTGPSADPDSNLPLPSEAPSQD
ncbi:hypothetical protein RLW55_04815 [Hyphomicrobium sp. B1]|uniref:hypothetical protein n=1 Tax=Hyphomicrobium sp. B1 TaxID=3075651 RepID=UPI003C2FDFB1